jgi:hypothetical protein
MPPREKTDFCDACFSPWYPRLMDEDGDPMENICDDCEDLIDDVPTGLRESDERPPICSCGVTMVLIDDEDPERGFICENPNCDFYGEEQT